MSCVTVPEAKCVKRDTTFLPISSLECLALKAQTCSPHEYYLCIVAVSPVVSALPTDCLTCSQTSELELWAAFLFGSAVDSLAQSLASWAKVPG